jgi:hypothetical protein
MRVGRFLLLPIFIAFLLLPIAAQQTSTTAQVPQRDSQATALLQAAIQAMGGSAPSDSVALGNVTLVEGSLTSSGTIRILTRGTIQTSVQVQANAKDWSVVYSNGQASRTEERSSTVLPLELAATTQSVYLPLPFLLRLLGDPDVAHQYVGPETVSGDLMQHIRTWDTFDSKPSLRFLSAFTVADIWFDASTNLPKTISFVRREGGGSTPKIPIAVSYSQFQKASGVVYASQIQESVNGTHWADITIHSIALNTGLTDSDFPVAQGAN